MKVGIITCLTCMFAVALTMGGPIRRQTSQSEKTVPIGGNVTLLCPLVTDDTLEWIYWQKNNRTIYSRNVNSQTTTNDTKYEGITYATRLTIKDLQETDSGIYQCKVSTTVNIEEGGYVMISVTDQEGGLFTTSPEFPVRASTTMPPKPPEDNTFYLAFLITLSILIIIIIIIIITMCLVFKYRCEIAESRLVKACQRLARTRNTSTPVPAEDVELQGGSSAIMSDPANIPPRVPDSTIPDQISPFTPLLLDESAQQGSQANVCDQADMPSRAQDIRPTTSRRLYASAPNDTNFRSTPLPYSSAHLQQGSPATSKLDPSDPCGPIFRSTPLPCSSAQASESGETQLPLIGQLLIDDLLYAYTRSTNPQFMMRMRPLLHLLVGESKGYSASLKKYAKCVPGRVLADVEYVLHKLDHIPVGRKRDVCEILLTMPENQEEDKSKPFSNMDISSVYGQKNQESADNETTNLLRRQMRSILRKSETKGAARNKISRTILDLYAASRNNQSANKTEQETSFQSQRDEDLDLEDDNLIRFWLSKVIKLDPTVQEIVIEQFDQLEHDAESSFMERTLDHTELPHDDAKEVKKTAPNKSADQERTLDHTELPHDDAKEVKKNAPNKSADQRHESRVTTSDDRVSAKPGRLKDDIVGPIIDKIYAADEEKAIAGPVLQNNDVKELMNTNLKKSTKLEKAIAGPVLQNNDVKELMNTNLKKSTKLNKKSIEIHGEKEKG